MSNLKTSYTAYLENEAENCWIMYEQAAAAHKSKRAWFWLAAFDEISMEIALIDESTAGWVARYLIAEAADQYNSNPLITGFAFGRAPIAAPTAPVQLTLF